MKYIVYISLGLISVFVIFYLNSKIKIQRGILYPETEGKKIVEDKYNKQGDSLPKFMNKDSEIKFIIEELKLI